MVRHIVLFQLEHYPDKATKAEALVELKNALEALPEQIPTLKRIEVALNINPAESYDLVLTAEASTMEELAIYASHPAHQQIVRELIKPHLQQRACVDIML